MTAMIILDFISKWRNAKNYKEKLESKGQRKKYDLDFRFPFDHCQYKIMNSIYESVRLYYFSFKATDDIRMELYLPFYVLYYTLMALHIQFAQAAFGITRRYHRLNLAIRNLFAISKKS